MQLRADKFNMETIESPSRIKSGLPRGRRLKRAARILKEEGARNLFFQLLAHLNCYRRLLLRERLLAEPIPEIKPNLPVTIELLKKNEVEEYLAFRQDADPSDVIKRINSGQWCFVARHNGRMVSACWATIHDAQVPYLGREIQLAEDEVFVYDAFTGPGFRGRSISSAIREKITRYFHAAGYRRMISVVAPENKPNLRAGWKVGFYAFGLIGYMKIGPWRRDFLKTFRRYDSI